MKMAAYEKPDLQRDGESKLVLKAETDLRITKLRVGLILNFKKPKLEFECVVL